jgi:hypothetical protein
MGSLILAACVVLAVRVSVVTGFVVAAAGRPGTAEPAEGLSAEAEGLSAETEPGRIRLRPSSVKAGLTDPATTNAMGTSP